MGHQGGTRQGVLDQQCFQSGLGSVVNGRRMSGKAALALLQGPYCSGFRQVNVTPDAMLKDV
jgi:hypothetical protein